MSARRPLAADEIEGRLPVSLLARYIHAPRGAAEEVAPRIGWTPSPLRLVDEEGEP